jgi:hypothetical protein
MVVTMVGEYTPESTPECCDVISAVTECMVTMVRDYTPESTPGCCDVISAVTECMVIMVEKEHPRGMLLHHKYTHEL